MSMSWGTVCVCSTSTDQLMRETLWEYRVESRSTLCRRVESSNLVPSQEDTSDSEGQNHFDW